MGNDIKAPWSAEVLRSRTFRRIRGIETYELKFTYTEGGQFIDVAFRGQEPHDVINVRDYATGGTSVGSKREVKAKVNEYMLGMTADELRKRFEESRPGSLGVR